MCKELIRLGWKAPGQEEQEEGTRSAFRYMLAAGSPGAYGVTEYRAGRKAIEWSSRGRSKL
ncbi:hypothetical protein HII31_13562 [Pseudocercospora fuligena]|uniref:Uncharacterized protein n=1 Tax=Pseudocercospora fuligena TaxID=685502 RepID=A0A8H6R7L1_9PEZI|nr:hypothetical protein HII31_13562 [Pseudocercospora fuligena]